jgi:hypothetical protein
MTVSLVVSQCREAQRDLGGASLTVGEEIDWIVKSARFAGRFP